MKAIRVGQFGAPEVLKIETVPDPDPGPGQVVVDIKAAGVNPVETYIRAGTYALKPELPFTPGKDGAGIVSAVGKDVTHIAPGDRMYTAGSISGTYAEKALCAAEQVHPLPGKISFAQGAAVNVPCATAYYGLFFRGDALPGDTVLIHGATGSVGSSAVQMAVASGMTVIGTGGTEKGRSLVKSLGAAHVLNHREPDYLSQVPELTSGRGVDVIIELLSDVNLGRDLEVIAMGGRIVVIGCRGEVTINPRLGMQKQADIRGMLLFNAPPEELRRVHAGIIAMMEAGTLTPVVGTELPLEEAPKAHTEVIESDAYGKIVLLP
jgi:NADPH2:quinone reductase